MNEETRAREQVATCTRILAMQQLMGLFGHISLFDPQSQRVYMSPSMGIDKATVTPDQVLVGDLEGRVLEGGKRLALEWPIHMALHRRRPDARAVAHLHAPYAVVFSASQTRFAPMTLEGTVFRKGLDVYDEPRLVTSMAQGDALADVMADRPAVLMRGHGIALAGESMEEMLYGCLILEDEARKQVRAHALGAFRCFSEEDAEAFNEGSTFAGRAQRCWHFHCQIEKRWDRQPNSGCVPFV